MKKMKKSGASGLDGISTETIRPITKVFHPGMTRVPGQGLIEEDELVCFLVRLSL